MKVLYTFGGIPHYLSAMLNKLCTKGVEITVVTPQKGNATIGKGVKMVEGGTYKHLTTEEKKMFYGKSAYPALPDIVRKEKPDILVMGWPYFLQIFFQPKLRRVMKECNTQLVIREIPFQTPPYGKIKEYFRANPMYDENMRLLSTGPGFYLKQWFTARIRKYCYARTAGTLNYSTVAYEILPSYGVKKEQIHVTYNSTDTEALLKEKETVVNSTPLLPPSERRLLHIGRLVKWKRVDLLINAFHRTIHSFPDAELVIVGDGPELKHLKQQAAESGLTDSIRFIGAVYDPEKLGAYMNESTVYVLAGMGGLSINDAMTYGMPVLCSVCDGTERDLVIDGKNGFFFKEGDADSLAEKISELFSSPALCKKNSQCTLLESVHDSFASLTITVRIVRLGHTLVKFFVTQQFHYVAHNGLGIRAHQFHCSSFHRFGPFGGVAHHKHRFAQRRRLFLYTPAIGQQQDGVLHGINKRQVVQRRDQKNVIQSGQQLINRFLHIRVQMHRVDDIYIGILRSQLPDSLTDVQEPFAEILTAVAGNEDIITFAHSVTFLLDLLMYLFFHPRLRSNDVDRHQQSVYHRIAGNEDFLLFYVLPQKILPGLPGRRKIIRADAVRHLAVHLLGPGRQHVVCAQPRFHMRHCNLPVKGSQ